MNLDYRKLTLSILALGLIIIGAPAFAGVEKAVDAGEVITLDLPVLDKDGNEQSLKSFTGEKGIVIAFVRSLDWCPYCQLQMIEMEDRVDDFKALGYNVVSISYDKPEAAQKYIMKHNRNVSVLFDPERKVIDTFKIMNTEVDPDHSSYGMAYPAIYVISGDGLIRKKLYEDGFKKRPEIDDVIKSIEKNFY